MHFALWHVCTVCCDIRPSFSSLCRQYFENATRETSFIGYSSESSALAVSQATLDIKPNYREDQKLDEQQYQQVGTIDLNLNGWSYLSFAVQCRWKLSYSFHFFIPNIIIFAITFFTLSIMIKCTQTLSQLHMIEHSKIILRFQVILITTVSFYRQQKSDEVVVLFYISSHSLTYSSGTWEI